MGANPLCHGNEISDLIEQKVEQTKVIAIHGGDWYDASADYVVLPDGVDINAEHKEYRKWYDDEYIPALRAGKKPEYKTFVLWLISRGATKPADDILEVFVEG